MSFSCPAPNSSSDVVVMGHGGGGRLSADLVRRVFLDTFGGEVLLALEDQATVPIAPGRIAITTDSFVVRPLFFPGGDIGRLAVAGTINDLVVGGARPRYLTAAFVLEEGVTIDVLLRIARSMKCTADEAGVAIIAGDTKVVERGKGDKVYVTTTGIGEVADGRSFSIATARPGDAILVSGTLGDHGMAVMSVREGLELDTPLESDCAPLGGLVEHLLSVVPTVRCMRDPTRGGLASALHEIAARSRVDVTLEEEALPVRREVRAACEVFGLDPLYVANEGKLVAIVAAEDADTALDALRGHPLGRASAIIGRLVASTETPIVSMRTVIGGERVVPLLAGEQLPRIC